MILACPDVGLKYLNCIDMDAAFIRGFCSSFRLSLAEFPAFLNDHLVPYLENQKY
jgi:hypothetical protein